MTEVIINGKWPLKLPDSSAKEWEGNMGTHDGEWEPERLDILKELIEPGTIVMYIGAYKGDMPALLASWGAKLIIIEATAGFWPLIKETWELNKLEKPIGMFSGLASDKTTTTKNLTDWPERTELYIEGTTGFSHLAESRDYYPEINIDELVRRLGVIPDLITVDVEGSELLVLQGGLKTLINYHPDLVLSVHPEFMFHNHGTYERELHDLLHDNGYKGTWLAYEHEHQWKYIKE